MTTYHVWLTGQDQPEVVRADVVGECQGVLTFFDIRPASSVAAVKEYQPSDWRKWSIVHDEADHI